MAPTGPVEKKIRKSGGEPKPIKELDDKLLQDLVRFVDPVTRGGLDEKVSLNGEAKEVFLSLPKTSMLPETRSKISPIWNGMAFLDRCPLEKSSNMVSVIPDVPQKIPELGTTRDFSSGGVARWEAAKGKLW